MFRKVVACALLHIENEKKKLKKRNRKYSVHPLFSERLIYGKFHTIHSKLKDYPDKFFMFYRMSTSSFEDLIALTAHALKRQDTRLRNAISPEERLSVTLR